MKVLRQTIRTRTAGNVRFWMISRVIRYGYHRTRKGIVIVRHVIERDPVKAGGLHTVLLH